MVANPYEILGVSQGASMDEIKRAYRRKAKENHPDLHPDDPRANERMQQVNEAYDMLSNPDKYRARRQARPNPGSYANYGSYGNTGYANRQSQGGWRYYTYTTGDQDAWRTWQDLRDEAYEERQRSRAPMVHPFRGILRVVSWILLFRMIATFLRILMFGFLP